MSINTWTSDAPAGVYKDSDFFENVLKPAAYDTVLYQLGAKRTIKQGESLTIAAWEQLEANDIDMDLQENVPMGVSKINITAKKITSQEKGRKLEISKRNLDRSPIDLLEIHKEALQRLLKDDLEKTGATALRTAKSTYVCDSATVGALRSDGTFVATADSDINIYHLENLGVIAMDDLRIPTMAAHGCYAGVFRYEAVSNVRQDSKFIELHQGHGLSPIADNRIMGKVGNIMVYQTNNPVVIAKGIGTGNAFSGGFLLGQESHIYAGVDSLKLKYDLSESSANDHGRFKHLAVLGDYTAATYSDSANAGLVRAIQIGSA